MFSPSTRVSRLRTMNSPVNRPPRKLRQRYSITTCPMVELMFEDGHGITICRNSGEVFDVWSDETIKAMTVYDPTSNDGKLLETKKSDAFHDASAQAKSSRSPRCEVAVRAVQSKGA